MDLHTVVAQLPSPTETLPPAAPPGSTSNGGILWLILIPLVILVIGAGTYLSGKIRSRPRP